MLREGRNFASRLLSAIERFIKVNEIRSWERIRKRILNVPRKIP